jgi:hypothetical protein
MPLPRPLNDAGPLLGYLSRLSGVNRDLADATVGAVRAVLSTPDGAMLLDLLEKSTLLSVMPVLSDDRALCARNAQALICSDLRRIMSDEHEQILRAKAGAKRP